MESTFNKQYSLEGVCPFCRFMPIFTALTKVTIPNTMDTIYWRSRVFQGKIPDTNSLQPLTSAAPPILKYIFVEFYWHQLAFRTTYPCYTHDWMNHSLRWWPYCRSLCYTRYCSMSIWSDPLSPLQGHRHICGAQWLPQLAAISALVLLQLNSFSPQVLAGAVLGILRYWCATYRIIQPSNYFYMNLWK